MKVLIATEKPFAPAAVEGIKNEIQGAGYEFVLLSKYKEKKELIAAVCDVDALIIRSDQIDAEVINAATNLKIIVRAGAGYDNVDLKEATKRNICVMNTPGQNANAVAELVFGMMIMAARNQFNGASGSELKGKKLGIHAYGNVGRNVARIARGMGMDIYAYDAYCPQVIQADGLHLVKSVEELYELSDIVSLHLPLTKETIQSINKDLLMRLGENGILINTARKEVVDESALFEYMSITSNFKYFTDIMPDNHLKFVESFSSRYFSTPKKMGAQTTEANINAGIAAAKEIVGYLRDGVDTFKVN